MLDVLCIFLTTHAMHLLCINSRLGANQACCACERHPQRRQHNIQELERGGGHPLEPPSTCGQQALATSARRPVAHQLQQGAVESGVGRRAEGVPQGGWVWGLACGMWSSWVVAGSCKACADCDVSFGRQVAMHDVVTASLRQRHVSGGAVPGAHDITCGG